MNDHDTRASFWYQTRVVRAIALSMSAVFVLGLFAYAAAVAGLLADEAQAGVNDAQSASQPVLRIAVARTPGGPRAWVGYAEAMAIIQHEIGPVAVRYIPDHDSVCDAISNGEVDAAFTCNTAFLRLREAGLAKPLVSPVINGTHLDAAQLVTAASSPYRRLADLKGRRVAVVSALSLSGRAYLDYLVEQHGLSEDYFGEVISKSSQERSLRDVLSGAADAAVVNRSQLAAFPPGAFRVLEQTDEFCLAPFVVRRGIDPEMERRLRTVLLGIERTPHPERGDVLEGFRDYDSRGIDVIGQLLEVARRKGLTE